MNAFLKEDRRYEPRRQERLLPSGRLITLSGIGERTAEVGRVDGHSRSMGLNTYSL